MNRSQMPFTLMSLALFSLGVIPARAQSVARAPAVSIPPARDAGEVLFTEQWKFFKGDDAKASETAFDDGAWRTLDLPHDWSIEGPFDKSLASCTAFLPAGIGWYRKSFTLPPEARSQDVSIRFDGVCNHSTVWCNGKLLGQRPYGYSSFTYDLTPSLRWDGSPNVIAVRVDHEQYADSRWYAGSGIYRNVYLITADKIHVDANGTYVTTQNVAPDHATVAIQTTLINDNALAADVSVNTRIYDPAGKIHTTTEWKGQIAANHPLTFAINSTIDAPVFWSPDHPAMYSAVTEINKDGQVLDRYTTPFGIRTCLFDPDKGFSINGQSMKIKGVCLHIEAGALGDAVPIQVWETRLGLLKEAGCNAIRCSHNPPAPEFLDLCDRMGFLVMDEAFDEWTRGKKKWIVGHNVGQPGFDGYHSDFDKWADIDISDMVRRDRNHPSIIMWSIGNEIDYTNDAYPPNSKELPPIAARLIKDVKAMDITRPVTAACAFPATNLYKSQLDIEGYNYMERLYAGDHAADPTRIMYGSENSQSLAAWESVASNDYISGQFLWTGADYLGEGGVWPSHGSGAGLLNLANFKKNQYYFRKSLWNDEPMVYLSTSGLFYGRGRPATAPRTPQITCFTNCDRVELFHDGQSLGEKAQTPAHVITWPLDFTSGMLHAVGHKGAAQVTYDLAHAGPAARLILLPDVKSLTADGMGVGQIELDVVDKDGTVVPDAAPLVTCALSGPGRLLGIENGNLNSTESYEAVSHSAYQGRMVIYLQSAKATGELTLSVSAPTLASATLTLPVKVGSSE